MTKEEMERTVLEESWWQNGPVGPSLDVIDNDYTIPQYGKLHPEQVLPAYPTFSTCAQDITN
jgi:hypothetical protein